MKTKRRRKRPGRRRPPTPPPVNRSEEEEKLEPISAVRFDRPGWKDLTSLVSKDMMTREKVPCAGNSFFFSLETKDNESPSQSENTRVPLEAYGFICDANPCAPACVPLAHHPAVLDGIDRLRLLLFAQTAMGNPLPIQILHHYLSSTVERNCTQPDNRCGWMQQQVEERNSLYFSKRLQGTIINKEIEMRRVIHWRSRLAILFI